MYLFLQNEHLKEMIFKQQSYFVKQLDHAIIKFAQEKIF